MILSPMNNSFLLTLVLTLPVKQSVKFTGTDVKMSKRGSHLARGAIHTISFVSIRITCKVDANNFVLKNYYLSKCQSKPKMVALDDVVCKVCNIISAVLRDEKGLTIINPDEHRLNYLNNASLVA